MQADQHITGDEQMAAQLPKYVRVTKNNKGLSNKI